MKIWLCTLLLACPAVAHADGQPSALVETAPLRKEAVTFNLSGYGTVFSDPGSTVNFSLPRSGQVTHLDVAAGQAVRRGATLFGFATDPVAANGYAQAESALQMAQSEFEHVNRLYAKQLATNAQLALARKALSDAQSAVHAQKKLGAGITQEAVKASFDGVVTALFAFPGDRLQAGKTVLQIARRNASTARIGMQPEDAQKIKAGMTVWLFPVFGKYDKLQGSVREVRGMIDPQTHLVDVIVSIGRKGDPVLLQGMKLRGEIEIPAGEAWVVPRSAVLTGGQGAYIFQDDRGRARRVKVTATENGEMTAIQGKFDPGLPVIVLGNYELQDGMRLREGNR